MMHHSPGRSQATTAMASKLFAAVLLLAGLAGCARAQDCYAVEVDSKYMIALGVYASNGGCIKGTKSGDNCNHNAGVMTQGMHGSLSACCDEVHARTRINPRNGQPMPDQANAKSVCLSGKKAVGSPASSGGQQQSQECFAMQTDLKYNQPLGVYGTNGGCIKGTKAADGQTCNTGMLSDGTRPEGLFGSLSACCDEVHARTRINPRNGQPMPDQANVKTACLAYKKP